MTKNLDSAGLKSIAENYDLFYIDLWGVIHNGVKLHGEAINVLKQLSKLKKNFVLLTNAPRPNEAVKIFLEKIGMEKELRDYVFSSGEASLSYLKKEHQSQKFYHIGPPKDFDLFKDFKIYKSDKINFFGLDSSNSKMLSNFLKKVEEKFSVKKFDVIIDDGSHILSDQLFSINYFYRYLKKGGYYIIEDYKFPNYYKRCNDVDENTIDVIIKKLKSNVIIKSQILQNDTIKKLYKAKIFAYKGRTKISDIVFFQKK